MLMGMAKVSEAINFRRALDIYLKALGQSINDESYWWGILDKFQSKFSHWTYRWLSSTGRVILLKIVV